MNTKRPNLPNQRIIRGKGNESKGHGIDRVLFYNTAACGTVRNVRAPKKERGFSRGLERLALTPLELLSLVTLFRNTKESNAHPGRGKLSILKNIMLATAVANLINKII